MSHGHFIKAIREWGLKETLFQFNQLRTIKFGTLVGTDKFGNRYYENYVDYQHPLNRWVVYARGKNFYEVDSSNVPPEWHGWLHSSTQTPPGENIGDVYNRPFQTNNEHTDAPSTTNIGGVISEYVPNQSLVRPRGFGLGNGLTGIPSEPNEEGYYTQIGHPLNPRSLRRTTYDPSKRVPFSLADTPATLVAKKEAERVARQKAIDEERRLAEEEYARKFPRVPVSHPEPLLLNKKKAKLQLK